MGLSWEEMWEKIVTREINRVFNSSPPQYGRAEMFGGPLIPPAVEEPPPGVDVDELVKFFLEHGWRYSSEGWQGVAERLLKEYVVTRRG